MELQEEPLRNPAGLDLPAVRAGFGFPANLNCLPFFIQLLDAYLLRGCKAFNCDKRNFKSAAAPKFCRMYAYIKKLPPHQHNIMMCSFEVRKAVKKFFLGIIPK